MQISGFQELTTIDYPGYTAAIIFTSPCNCTCPFCHNPQFIKDEIESLNEEKILAELMQRKKLLDGVVITGGEPTLQPDLIPFVKKIKTIGLKVKLDTNGSNSSKLEHLLFNELVDYVALDVKAPADKYEQVVGTKFNVWELYICISNLIHGPKKVDYEIRTTVVPTLLEKGDIIKIGEQIRDAKLYVLQQFVPTVTYNSEFQKVKPYPIKVLKSYAEAVKGYVKKVIIR